MFFLEYSYSNCLAKTSGCIVFWFGAIKLIKSFLVVLLYKDFVSGHTGQ